VYGPPCGLQWSYRYIKFIVRYMDVGFGDLRTKSSRPNIIIYHIGTHTTVVEFENVLRHGCVANGMS